MRCMGYPPLHYPPGHVLEERKHATRTRESAPEGNWSWYPKLLRSLDFALLISFGAHRPVALRPQGCKLPKVTTAYYEPKLGDICIL